MVDVRVFFVIIMFFSCHFIAPIYVVDGSSVHHYHCI